MSDQALRFSLQQRTTLPEWWRLTEPLYLQESPQLWPPHLLVAAYALRVLSCCLNDCVEPVPAAPEVLRTACSVLDVAAGNCAAPAAAAPPVTGSAAAAPPVTGSAAAAPPITGSAAVGCAWEAEATAVVGVGLMAVCCSLTSGLEAGGAGAPAVDIS